MQIRKSSIHIHAGRTKRATPVIDKKLRRNSAKF